MYSLRDAERLRSRLLKLLEKQISSSFSEPACCCGRSRSYRVETAGADTLRRTSKHLYPKVDLSKAAVLLTTVRDKLSSLDERGNTSEAFASAQSSMNPLSAGLPNQTAISNRRFYGTEGSYHGCSIGYRSGNRPRLLRDRSDRLHRRHQPAGPGHGEERDSWPAYNNL